MFRIGFGYDVHQLIEKERLILGGIEIPFKSGLKGYSDADVLIHAVIDALLGALALGDIGMSYPDSDNTYKNIDSRILLRKTYKVILEKGWYLNNLDATICAQKPKLQSYIHAMRKNIADDLEIDIENISIKATTEEYLGISGSEKGMTAYCVVLLVNRKNRL